MQFEIQDWLTERVAHLLEVSTAELDPSVPLAEFGIDSPLALVLCGEIEDAWGIEVDPVLVYDHPTIVEIARHLNQRQRAA
jgi:acyl carrier protein